MKKQFVIVATIFALIGLFASCDEILDLIEETTEAHVCSFGDWEVEKEATCTKSGRMVRSCECGEEETTRIKSTGHKPTVIEATPGWTEGECCAVCGEILVEQESLPGNTETTAGEAITEEESWNGGATDIGDPGDYSYTECNETVYVNNPGSVVTLRTADYEAKGSIVDGTALKRTGLSTDEANYWSKVEYEGATYYVASKFLTNINNPDEGFVAVDKIVVVNDETGSLNIRNLPTFKGSAVIGWALAGEETRVIAENTETGWYKIEFTAYGGEVMTGYIKSSADSFVQEDCSDVDTTEEEDGSDVDTTEETVFVGK